MRALAVLLLPPLAAGELLEEPFEAPNDLCGVSTAVNDDGCAPRSPRRARPCSRAPLARTRPPPSFTPRTWRSRHVELFALSERRSVLHARQLDGSRWSGWDDLGGLFSGGPVAAKNANNRLEVFAPGVDRKLYRRESVGTCGDKWAPERWECIGGCFTGGPTIAASAEGLLNLFMRGCDRAVWRLQQRREKDGSLSWPDTWDLLGGVISSTPQAVLDAEGMLHVFARGITRALVHTSQAWNGTAIVWQPWASLGGALASGASVGSAAVASDSLLSVFVRASDKALWRRHQVANASRVGGGGSVGWAHWESLGGVLSGGVAVASQHGQLDVFTRGADRELWHKRQGYRHAMADLPWERWQTLSGSLSTTPAIAVTPAPPTGGSAEDTLHVFARGARRPAHPEPPAMKHGLRATPPVPLRARRHDPPPRAHL